MKPLQHAQISAKTYGGGWTDYIEVHNFLDSSKATCAHFKHRFLLHHAEGIELGVRIFGETVTNSENKTIETRRLLTNHLIEDVGRLVKVDDWARDLLPDRGDSFYKFLAKKRGQIEAEQVPGESELLGAFNLSEKDRAAVKAFLCFPLENSAHAGALLISHNSFAVYLAEQVWAAHSSAEIIARTASREWMRGADAGFARAEKKRLANH